ncbi:MAG: shufflon system plasmid conjugative transfer pilus tip adhesin PilV [Candidatus Symbiodolus clandestinus]
MTAQQLQQVTKAAQNYVQDHYQQLSQNTDTSLTWDTLKNNGYISKSLAEINHYNQNYQFTLQKDKGFL